MRNLPSHFPRSVSQNKLPLHLYPADASVANDVICDRFSPWGHRQYTCKQKQRCLSCYYLPVRILWLKHFEVQLIKQVITHFQFFFPKWFDPAYLRCLAECWSSVYGAAAHDKNKKDRTNAITKKPKLPLSQLILWTLNPLDVWHST